MDLTAKTTTVRIDVTAQDGSTTAYGLQIRNPALSAPPVLTLADLNPSIDENTPPPTVPKLSNRIARIETSGPDGDDREMTFSLDTASQQFFTILPASIKNAAVLHNKVSLDHEAMPTHDVIFTATDEDDVSASITVTITVNDVNEPGTVQFIPPTAITGIPVIAFVNDPEEPVSGETWQWYQGDAQGGPWTRISGQTSNTYTPADADEGKFFRVTATYNDVLGSGRSAEGVTDGPTVSTVCIDQTNACSQDDPGSLAIGAPARARTDGIADTDWFRFTTQADKIYRIDMMGADTGHGNLPDPYLQGLLAVFDENDAYQADGLVDDPSDQLRYVWRDWFTGQQHLDNSQYNDDGGDGRNARLFIRTGAITGLIDTPGYPAGVYYVGAKPLAENANDIGNDATYQIVIDEVDDQPASPVSINTFSDIATVTGYLDFPGDQDPFTIDLPALEKLLISTTGAAAAPFIGHSTDTMEPQRSLADDGIGNGLYPFTPQTGGIYNVIITTPTGSHQNHGTGAYTVTIALDPDESNLTLGTPVDTWISGRGDKDVFIADLNKGSGTFQKYRIDILALDSGNGTLADPRLTVRSGETKVHSDDGGQGRNARAYINVGGTGFAPGDIRIEVEADTTGSYQVVVDEVPSNHLWFAHMRPANCSTRHEGYCRAFSTRTVTVTEQGETKQKEIHSGGCAIDTTIEPFGIISRNRISLAGTDYDLVALLHDSISDSVDFATTQQIPSSQLTNVVLTIQGIEFSFSDAGHYTTIVDGTDRYYHDWDSDQPPWTMGNRLHDWVLVELSTKP